MDENQDQQENFVLTPDHILSWFRATDTILACERNGVRFVLPAKDSCMTRSVFYSGNSDAEFLPLFLELAEKHHGSRSGPLVDAGANIGTTTLHALKSHPSVTHVYAFEPFPLNYDCLRASLCLNSLDHRATVVNAALGNYCGEVMLSIANDGNLGDNRITFGNDAEEIVDYGENTRGTMPTQLITLNHYFENSPPVAPIRYLWVDTQGVDCLVLMGADKVLQDDTSIDMEFWPYAMLRNNSLDESLKFLKANFSKFIVLHDIVEGKYKNLRRMPESMDTLDALVEDLLPNRRQRGVQESVDLFLLR